MRPYRDPDDLPAYEAFYRRYADRFFPCPAPDKLAGFPEKNGHVSFPNEELIVIWEKAGEIYGVATFDQYHDLDFYFVPRTFKRTEQDEMMAWLLALASERRFDHFGYTLQVSCSVLSTDKTALACLKRHRFKPDGDGAVYMLRSLAEPLQAVLIPEGIQVRMLADEHELAPWLKLHNRLSYKLTPAEVQGITGLVAAVAGETWIGVARFLLDEPRYQHLGQPQARLLSPCVQTPYRQTPLAAALINTGLASLREQGYPAVETVPINDDDQVLYQQLGFTIECRQLRFVREVSS